MGQEAIPSSEGLRKITEREEALEKLKKDLAHGLSVSDEEFEREKEGTMEELGAKKGRDYERVKKIRREKKGPETIH